jgi:hypothetical protein
MVHEFAHVLVAHLGLSEDEAETRCDRFAAEVLMPREAFFARFVVCRAAGAVGGSGCARWSTTTTTHGARGALSPFANR